MRYPRLRRDHDNTFYHCYNRVDGTSSDRSFGPAEKENFIRMVKRLARYDNSPVPSPPRAIQGSEDLSELSVTPIRPRHSLACVC